MPAGPASRPQRSPLMISIAVGPGSAAVTVTGTLDALEAPNFRQKLDTLLDEECLRLLVDLSKVSFIDSAGLAVLVRARRLIGARGGEVVLVSPQSPNAQRVFTLTKFDEVFRMVSGPGQW
jgi:anti-sigma B factor antagonist